MIALAQRLAADRAHEAVEVVNIAQHSHDQFLAGDCLRANGAFDAEESAGEGGIC